jgi:hypothetical protein
LPIEYRRRGIGIGDVGIITAAGGFDFMFNVCLPEDHPINRDGVPDGFSSVHPELLESDVHKQMEFNPNSYLASSSIEKSHGDGNPSYVYLITV